MSARTGSLARLVAQIRSWAVAGGADGLADGDLVRRYVTAQDEAAFSCLVQRHGPMVLGLCRKLLRNEPFDGKLRLAWKVVRPDEKHRSLTKHKGKLTITTQKGSIHGKENPNVDERRRRYYRRAVQRS